MNLTDFVRVFPAFRTGPDGLVRDLLTEGRRQAIPAGAQIYREGDQCSGIAFVLSGDIRVFKIGQTGREITLYEIGQGETCILNASRIMSGKNYPANAVALSEVMALIVPADVFRRLLRKYEVMRTFVFTILSQRLSGVMELVEEVAFGRMDARLADYLEEKSENGHVESTHQKIANDLGTSREVVSRLLKDMERQGKVQISRNTIHLLNME
jgi:CRP/FNR family transcriptional regulator, anaerobic regulatory protein